MSKGKKRMTAADIGDLYVKVSSAAEQLHVDAATIYRLLQRGSLKGLSIDGSKFIEIASLEKAKREKDQKAS